MRAQARGLARAIGGHISERIIRLREPWASLRPDFTPFPLRGLDPAWDRPAAPWPDLLVTCGRRSAAASMAIRRAGRGRTLTVHIGDPRAGPSGFDLVAPMAHDRLRGANVTPVLTAMHETTPERLAEAGRIWRQPLAHLPRPLIGVLIGGSTRRRAFGHQEARALLKHLETLRRSTFAGLAVTVSRRTPEAVRRIIEEAVKGLSGAAFWDGSGPNPYHGVLALSDRLVVTGDSVTMISEALATTAPVEVFDFGCARRHRRFLRRLTALGLIGVLGAVPAPQRRPRVDATEAVARQVRALLANRGFSLSLEPEFSEISAAPGSLG